ncbi:LysR family transcriptional regulator [Kiloniella sp. b19]|uniref:LysR family transcriptional regulator n=1 Tax=Kiloniella sp. GXU_MW_B19 TaxID=3141326 RepID=UPI0031E42C63
MEKDFLDGLPVFLEVARQKSFSRAGKTIGISASAVSQTIRQIEGRIGVPLFYRTTRSVALTEAGQELFARVAPAAQELKQAFEHVHSLSPVPKGLLRINVPSIAIRSVLEHVTIDFCKKYPDITLDIVMENRTIDIVEEGFDAGIRLGEMVQPDMVWVLLMGTIRSMLGASPAYLEQYGTPQTLEDLANHNCIQFRLPSTGQPYRWHFMDGEKEIQLATNGNLIVNSTDLMLRAGLDGLGIIYLLNFGSIRYFESGQLVEVLRECSVPEQGLGLYFPRRAQQSTKLRVFVDFLRERKHLFGQSRERV